MKPRSTRPAKQKRSPAEKSGGSVCTAMAIARYVEPQMTYTAPSAAQTANGEALRVVDILNDAIGRERPDRSIPRLSGMDYDLSPEPQMMNQTDIVTVDLGSHQKRVLTAKTNTSDAHPRYSPDGRSLVFHSYDTKRAFNDQGHLVLLQRKTGAMRLLAPKYDRATTHVAWTPDSRALVFPFYRIPGET